jgi:hypothetical protein
MLQSDIIYIKSLIHSAAYSHASHQPSSGSRREEWVAEGSCSYSISLHPLWEAADHGGPENRVEKMRLAQCHAESVPLAT